MPNLITQYTNGTFEGALGTWGAEFGVASSAEVQDPTEFYEGANSVKLTTEIIGTSGFFNGVATLLLCRFPATDGQPYEVTVRIKCNEDVPDSCFFFIDPFSFGTTQENIGFPTPKKASFAKDGWVELKANFYGETVGGEVIFYVNVLFNSVEYNNALESASEEFQEWHLNISTLAVNETIPAGAFIWLDALTADVVAVPVTPDIQFDGRRLYHVQNVFYLETGLTRIVIDEPIKWDQVTVQVIFDEKTKAYRFEFSDKDVLLEFDNRAGREILRTEYKAKGVNGDVRLIFGEYNSITDELTIHFIGSINFEDCEDGEKTFKANIERQSFGEKLRTYFDTRVDIFREASLGGLSRPALDLKELFLHPRLLTYKAEYIYNQNIPEAQGLIVQDYSPAIGDDGKVYVNIPPFKAEANNIDGLGDPVSPDGLLVYAGLTLPPGVLSRKFFIECKQSFKYTKTGSPQQPLAGFGILKVSNISLGASTDGLVISSVNPLGHTQLGGILAGTNYVDGNFAGTIELGPDEALFLRTTIYNEVEGDPVVVYSDFEYTNSESFYLNIEELTVVSPSLIKAPLLHEIVNRQLELIVDQPDVLKSNLLGRIDLGYAANGCAAYHFGADGKIIRKFKDRAFNLSAKDWYNSIDGLFCTGMSIERDNDENESVRFEELPYFFRDTLLIKLNTISNYVSRPAKRYLFNEIEARFTKYPQDNQQDSLEDFHTAMSYVTPLTKIKGKLNINIPAIISGYYIEYTRQESFNKKPTNAYETDNDLFFISAKESSAAHVGQNITFDQDNKIITVMKIIPVVSGDKITIANGTGFVTNGTYLVNNVEIPFTYDRVIMTVVETLATDGAGTGDVTLVDINSDPIVNRYEAKRDEDFDVVTGVTNPKSVYNLEHHLKRVVLRWAKVFQSGWTFLITGDVNELIQGIQFTEGANNTSVRTKLKEAVACRYGDSLRLDRLDSANESVNHIDKPLFDKDEVEFDAPLTWTGFNYIRYGFEGRHPDGRDYGYVQYPNLDGKQERGFVLSMKFDPNKQMCKFTLIKKYDG